MATTREEWLTSAVEKLRADFVRVGARPFPDLRLSVGWPSRGALAQRKRRIGECWAPDRTADEFAHVFISPTLSDPVDVLATLGHELIHATLPTKAGHRSPFRRIAVAFGFTGKMTATAPSEALKVRLNALAAQLGPYPHVALVPSNRTKQSTRLRLFECSCPVKVRVARDEFNATCGDCGERFERSE